MAQTVVGPECGHLIQHAHARGLFRAGGPRRWCQRTPSSRVLDRLRSVLLELSTGTVTFTRTAKLSPGCTLATVFGRREELRHQGKRLAPMRPVLATTLRLGPNLSVLVVGPGAASAGAIRWVRLPAVVVPPVGRPALCCLRAGAEFAGPARVSQARQHRDAGHRGGSGGPK
jgi:hypothetical protein